MTVLGEADGPEERVTSVAVDETGKQTGQSKDGRSSGSLAVEERDAQHHDDGEQSQQETAVQVRPQHEDKGKSPQPARQGQRESENHDKAQEGVELRPDVEERRPDRNGGQHGEIGAP
jgi:hypothetical protein